MEQMGKQQQLQQHAAEGPYRPCNGCSAGGHFNTAEQTVGSSTQDCRVSPTGCCSHSSNNMTDLCSNRPSTCCCCCGDRDPKTGQPSFHALPLGFVAEVAPLDSCNRERTAGCGIASTSYADKHSKSCGCLEGGAAAGEVEAVLRRARAWALLEWNVSSHLEEAGLYGGGGGGGGFGGSARDG
jgi:hypothetical protein